MYVIIEPPGHRPGGLDSTKDLVGNSPKHVRAGRNTSLDCDGRDAHKETYTPPAV